LSWRDVSSAKEFLEGKEKFTEWCHKLEREHFQRVKSRGPATLGSSAYFLDVLNNFRRINVILAVSATPSRMMGITLPNEGDD
jgi:Na+/phosphate symporter